jgi:ankyrin repeat protein
MASCFVLGIPRRRWPVVALGLCLAAALAGLVVWRLVWNYPEEDVWARSSVLLSQVRELRQAHPEQFEREKGGLLWDAVYWQDPYAGEFLLDHGADARQELELGNLLHVAAYRADRGPWGASEPRPPARRQGVLKPLLQGRVGDALLRSDHYSWPVLDDPARQARVIELLVAHGADAAARGAEGKMPIEVAARSRAHPKLLEALVRSIKCSPYAGEEKWLVADSIVDYPAVLDVWASEAPSVDMADEHGLTALHHAAWCGFAGSVEALLSHGASVCSVTDSGETPLHVAVARRSGGGLFAPGMGGVRPAEWGADRPGQRADVVQLLLGAGADVGATDAEGLTALDYADRSSQSRLVRLLQGSGDDGMDVEGLDVARLHWGAVRGDVVTVRVLLEQGLDVNAQDATGRTALDFALGNGHEELAEFLREHGGLRGSELAGPADLGEPASLPSAGDAEGRPGEPAGPRTGGVAPEVGHSPRMP